MSAESISLAAGVLLSLALSYIPTNGGRWTKLDPDYKRLIMLGLLVLVSGGAYALQCLGWMDALGLQITCDQTGLFALLRQLVIAIIANQSIYSISPKFKRQ